MKVGKNNSWKEKIDPAFDDLIKVYLDYIKRSHICSTQKHKRYLFLDDESLKVLKRKGYPPLLKEFKQNQKNLKELTNDATSIGASPDSMLILEYFKNMENPFNKNEKKRTKRENKNENSDALELTIKSMIKGLPREDSRNYYKQRLGIYLSPEKTKPFIEGKTQKELKKISSERQKDILCLMYQTGIRGYWDSQSESFNDKKINKSNLINT